MITALALVLSFAAADTVQSNDGPITVERLATLEFPWGMCNLPDGSMLITEKPGRLRMFSNGELSSPISGVPRVAYRDQGGLLDVQVDAHFGQNRFVYLYYAEPAANQPRNARDPWDPRLGEKPNPPDNVLKGGAVARARLVGNSLQGLKVIWRQTPKTIGRGHFGGRMAFAPDGKLIITSGDRQRFTPAQDLHSNLGKTIRINPDGSIPRDNPFANRRGVRGDIWSMGHRNPLGAAVNGANGKIYVHEMGPLGGDEINSPGRGMNYGWPIVSNGDNYNHVPIPDHDTRPQFVKPLIYWQPVISPSGMIFYTGTQFPKWRGNALIGGLSSMALIRVSVKGNVLKEEERIGMHKRIRDVNQAPDGSILVLTDDKNGELLRLTPGR